MAHALVIERVVADVGIEEVRIEGFNVLSERIVIFRFNTLEPGASIGIRTTRPSDLARLRTSAPEPSSTSTPSLPRGMFPAIDTNPRR